MDYWLDFEDFGVFRYVFCWSGLVFVIVWRFGVFFGYGRVDVGGERGLVGFYWIGVVGLGGGLVLGMVSWVSLEVGIVVWCLCIGGVVVLRSVFNW